MEAMKKIPELPEDIIYHILSFPLTIREVTRLSLVSKQFFGFLQKHPNLKFFPHEYDLVDKSISYKQRMNRHKQRMNRSAKELKYLNYTLDRYLGQDIQLQNFTLQADSSDGCGRTGDRYNRCIELAAKLPGLKKLVLWSDLIVLPQAVFKIESLVELELRGFHLNPETVIVWPNLISLTLNCVASKEVLDSIVIGCPLIENLELGSLFRSSCFNLDLSNLRNLKKLKILFRSECLEVMNGAAAPNLESIDCCSMDVIYLGDTEYPSLKTLTASSDSVIMDGHLFDNFARKFAELQKLHLDCSLTSQAINLSSTSLKEIELILRVKLQEAAFLDFDVPNLVCFKYTCRRLNECRLPVLSFAGNSDGWRTSSIEIDARYDTVDTLFFEDLNQTLLALNSARNWIALIFRTVLFNHEELARSAIFVQGVREFSLIADNYYASRSTANAILDYVFLICRPQTITLSLFMLSTNKDLTRVYEELISRSRKDRLRVTLRMPQNSATFEDWDKFVEVWHTAKEKCGTKNISFHLEYSS